MRRRLGDWNAVRGAPGWYYGLRIVSADGSVVFDVGNPETGESITDLRASGYRTTTLARRMGVRDLNGYQHVAQEAIRARSVP